MDQQDSHAIERRTVGDPKAPVIPAGDAARGERALDLRPRAVHEDEPDAEAVQHVDVVDQIDEARIGDDFTGERDDERTSAKSMDVRRCRAKPVDEAVHAGEL